MDRATAIGAGIGLTLLMAVLPLVGQSHPTATAPASVPSGRFGEPHALFTIQSTLINEASGLLASRANPGVYFTHNDSGGRPEIYALDSKGGLQTTIVLDGASNVDWEDIGFAPATTGGAWDIIAADIGDNQQHRGDIRLYRFAEPRLPKDPGSVIHVQPAVFRLKYEIGAANAEAFFVNPANGDGYIITKRSGAGQIVRVAAPWKPDAVNDCARVGEIDLPIKPGLGKLITAADISIDGQTVVLRTYTSGWLLRMPSGGTGAFETIFSQPPEQIQLAIEPQGEAICFSADGRCILTTSEGIHPAVNECCAAVPVGERP